MSFVIRTQSCCLAILLLLSATARSSPSFPDLKDDSIRRIRRDLETVGREYLALSKPSRTTMTTMSYKLKLLEKRCDRLGGESNAELASMLAIIGEFKELLEQRSRQEAERRNNEKKPYVFDSISGPTLQEGGHTQKGAQYLVYEVDEFVKHYRRLKHTKFTHNEVYLDHSRSYFRRTIEASVETALRRIDDPKPDNVVIISAHGGLVYDNYSPEENLQWALNVAQIAQYFESQVGGSVAPWVQWQRKIRTLAAQHRIAVK